MRPWLCTFYHFPCTSLPRDVHQATHRRTKEPVSPLQDSFSKCERGFVAGSTFKRNKPGKTKFCQGDAHPVLILRAVKSHSFVFFFFSNTEWHVGSQFPHQGSNLCPLQWKRGVLTIEPPGKSLTVLIMRQAHPIQDTKVIQRWCWYIFKNWLSRKKYICFL